MQANMNDFALLPDNGPARLLRFSTLPHPTMLSLLDPAKNILRISAVNYGQLTPSQQAAVDVTHEVCLGVTKDPYDHTYRVAPWVEPQRNYPEPVTHCH